MKELRIAKFKKWRVFLQLGKHHVETCYIKLIILPTINLTIFKDSFWNGYDISLDWLIFYIRVQFLKDIRKEIEQ